MPSGFLRVVATLAVLVIAAPVYAAAKHHQLIEPIQPDRRRNEATASPPVGKLCYCHTVHQRNTAGRLTWKVVCSEKGPTQGARKIRADDCRAIRNLPPS